ncbi:MAG: hypothetical protein KBF93_03840 [Leptospiraceae bacterium]|nr:hypothetical protein [Leptospiraceae bacterium]
MNLKSFRIILVILLFVLNCKKFQAFFEEEKIPDITNPKIIMQDLFELKYPSNWIYQEDKENKINLDFKSYLIESSGNSYIQIFVYGTAMDNKACVDEFKSEFEEDLIESEKIEERDSWGKQKGYGVKLTGKILFLNPGSVNIFCFTEKENTFSIIEFYYESDFEKIKPGLFLIQSSFKLF